MKTSTVILTYNSEASIEQTLAAAARVSADIHIVDSYSTDRTLDIASRYTDLIVSRHFINYSEQRNWAIDNLPLATGWELHLDADEQLSDGLIQDIIKLDPDAAPLVSGYYVPRLTRFLGRDLRFGGYYPNYHMRLFRRKAAFVEHRKYDQHFVLKGPSGILNSPLIDDHVMTLAEWTARHNRWSDLEVEDVAFGASGEELLPNPYGTPPERQRAKKGLYYKMPLFLRAAALFFYRYILLGGFLDGTPGLIYCFLQTFWYRFLVDAKLFERSNRVRQQGDASRMPV